jgi:hypothetical protein
MFCRAARTLFILYELNNICHMATTNFLSNHPFFLRCNPVLFSSTFFVRTKDNS